MVLAFSTEFASCPSKAPITKTECVYPKGHPGKWHLGFTDDDFCRPMKWDADAIETLSALSARLRDG